MQKAVAKGLNIRMNEAIELKRQQENFIDVSDIGYKFEPCPADLNQTVSHEIRNPMSAVLHCAEEIGASLTEYNATVSGSTAHRNPDAPSSIGLHERLQSAIDAAQIIVHCVMHQKRIIDDVLTLSKLDSDLLTISPIAVRPIETAQEALKLFEVELRTADIQWDIVEDQSLQDLKADWVLLDPSRLHQVLINLLTNAIKFTRDQSRREISVKIAATKERPTMDSRSVYYLSQYGPRRNSRVKHDDNQGDGIYLSMAIKDTGKGLSADEKARLFKRFAQGSPKTYVQYGGSGLGLFISRQITEMMGGEIGVASEEGEGSTIVFFVKTQIASKPADSPDNVAPPSTTDQQSKTVADDSSFTETRHAELDDDTPPAGFPTLAKILIVEDNLVNQKVLNQALTSRGYVVAAANHGGEALEQLHKTASCRGGGGEERAFDVILMDIEMPVMGGIACMREIRNLEAQGRLEGRVTVIGVTANARDEHVKAAMGAGMDGVTTKPYRLEDLVAEMRRAYESRRGGKV
jgi:signal transduction histidine kinase/ActR/RegA family two-component response regulator